MYGMDKIDVLTRAVALYDSAQDMDNDVDYTRPDASDIAKVIAMSSVYQHAAMIAIQELHRVTREYENLKVRFEQGPPVAVADMKGTK